MSKRTLLSGSGFILARMIILVSMIVFHMMMRSSGGSLGKNTKETNLRAFGRGCEICVWTFKPHVSMCLCNIISKLHLPGGTAESPLGTCVPLSIRRGLARRLLLASLFISILAGMGTNVCAAEASSPEGTGVGLSVMPTPATRGSPPP